VGGFLCSSSRQTAESELAGTKTATELLRLRPKERKRMLHWSLVFLVIALIAGALGFSGIAGAAAGIAKILFVLFLVIWLVVFLVIGRVAKG
jgi:uncharacterized membrane protein YtjA (UPF0391 family)